MRQMTKTEELVAKAKKQLDKLDVSARFSDRQLYNLMVSHLPEVYLPILRWELWMRVKANSNEVCPGWRRCHGALSWCEKCGDVKYMCDETAVCDLHRERRATEEGKSMLTQICNICGNNFINCDCSRTGRR